MVEEIRLRKVGGSNFLIIPAEFVKVYKLQKYVYHVEVSSDGKTVTYRRMRKDEKLSHPEILSN